MAGTAWLAERGPVWCSIGLLHDADRAIDKLSIMSNCRVDLECAAVTCSEQRSATGKHVNSELLELTLEKQSSSGIELCCKHVFSHEIRRIQRRPAVEKRWRAQALPNLRRRVVDTARSSATNSFLKLGPPKGIK